MENEMTPSLDSMTQKHYSYREWLQYYQNAWNRTLVARVADMYFDSVRDPNEPTEEAVLNSQGKERPKLIKERLQERKAKVQAAKELLKTFSELAKILAPYNGNEAFEEKFLSADALKIDESAFQEEAGPKAGGACKTIDNKDGTWHDDGKGNLFCLPPEDDQPEPDAAL